MHNVMGAVKDAFNLLHGQRGGRRSGEDESIEVDADMLDRLVNERSHDRDAAAAALNLIHRELLPRSDDSVRQISFNLVDEVVHLLDTTEEPWTVQLEVRVAGTLDERRLRAALHEAVGRHLMARVRMATAERSWNRSYWDAAPELDVEPSEVSHAADDADVASGRARLYSARIPLAGSPPLRARLARQPEGDVLMLNLSHVATDGVGGLRLLHSVARAYSGAEDRLPEVNLVA